MNGKSTTIPSTVIRWGDITIRLVELTPELGKQFLEETAHVRRKLKYRVVESYKADMQDGNWAFNGDAIRRAADGSLLDGQHRINAAIEAGETIVILLVEGLDIPAQDTMDDGAKRTFSDTLRMRGENYPDVLSGVLWRVSTWDLGGGVAHGSRIRATKAQKSAALEKYPWLRELAPSIKRVASQAGMAPSLTGFAWWMFSQIDEGDAEFFFNRLADGQGLSEGDPVYELRKTLRGRSPNLDNDRWMVAVIIKMWNAYRAGEYVKQVKFTAGGAHPEAFPVPR
jgi:hypothetical protein